MDCAPPATTAGHRPQSDDGRPCVLPLPTIPAHTAPCTAWPPIQNSARRCGGIRPRSPDRTPRHGRPRRLCARDFVREKPIIGIHAQLWTVHHRPGEDKCCHPTRQSRRHRFGEKHPCVRAVSRARTFNRRRHAHFHARIPERRHIRLPGTFIEVRRHKPAGFILEQRVHTRDKTLAPPCLRCLSRQMASDHVIGNRNEFPRRTLRTLHPRLFTHTALPFITAARLVPATSCGGTLKTPRKNIYSSTEQASEQRDFRVFWRLLVECLAERRCGRNLKP